MGPRVSARLRLTTAVHFCFHLNGVSGLKSSHNPCGWVVPTDTGISGNLPHSPSTGCRGHHSNRGRGIWRMCIVYTIGTSSSSLSLSPPLFVVCVFSPIGCVSLENFDLHREVEREVSGCSYKKITGILVIKLHKTKVTHTHTSECI